MLRVPPHLVSQSRSLFCQCFSPRVSTSLISCGECANFLNILSFCIPHDIHGSIKSLFFLKFRNLAGLWLRAVCVNENLFLKLMISPVSSSSTSSWPYLQADSRHVFVLTHSFIPFNTMGKEERSHKRAFRTPRLNERRGWVTPKLSWAELGLGQMMERGGRGRLGEGAQWESRSCRGSLCVLITSSLE